MPLFQFTIGLCFVKFGICHSGKKCEMLQDSKGIRTNSFQQTTLFLSLHMYQSLRLSSERRKNCVTISSRSVVKQKEYKTYFLLIMSHELHRIGLMFSTNRMAHFKQLHMKLHTNRITFTLTKCITSWYLFF